jgi:predicted tellurium resistance membrane protein TerC
MLDVLLQPATLISLLTLTLMEIVLGIDNIVFISILVGRLPPERQPPIRRIGLLLALVMRLGLLFTITWIMRLTVPLFAVLGKGFSGRDLILIGGGLFLIYKAVREIHEKLEGADHGTGSAKTATLAAVLGQIFVIDLVFSFDSVITAVGMVDNLLVIITAVVLSFGIMLFASKHIFGFVNRHPSVKLLALAFLVMIGVFLIVDGFGIKVDKALIYVPMAFNDRAVGLYATSAILAAVYRRERTGRGMEIGCWAPAATSMLGTAVSPWIRSS